MESTGGFKQDGIRFPIQIGMLTSGKAFQSEHFKLHFPCNES
jgi:hypothetical protein